MSAADTPPPPSVAQGRSEKLRYDPPNLYYYNGVHMGEVLAADDGYYVWWPANHAGFLDQGVLLAVAELLASLNADWDAQVKAGVGG